jgi:hypothetical protein
MQTQPQLVGWRRTFLARAALLGLMACCATTACIHRHWVRSSTEVPGQPIIPTGATTQPAPPAPPPAYDVTIRAVAPIAPGTVIAQEPPQGWSHLIIKSLPRAAHGDLDVLSDTHKQLASLLKPALVADVVAEQKNGGARYRFHRAGVGVLTSIQGRDTVITPDTHRQLGANLGFLASSFILPRVHEGQQKVRQVVTSDSLAVLDTPATLVVGNRHRPVRYRYALLVEAHTGRLDALVWRIDLDEHGRYAGAAGPIEWLPPSLIEDAALHVDRNEFTLGIASDIAFATYRLPPGQKQLPLTDDLKSIAGKPRLTATEAHALDVRLREALRRAGP